MGLLEQRRDVQACRERNEDGFEVIMPSMDDDSTRGAGGRGVG